MVSIKIVDETDDGKDKIISNYKGEVIDINIRAKEITIQVESMKVTFIPADNVRVYFKEELGDFNEIMVGDNVKVIVDTRNRAREIYIDRKRVIETQDRFDVISGVIRNIYRNSIEVMVGKRIREYEYADTMEILVGRDDGSLRILKKV